MTGVAPQLAGINLNLFPVLDALLRVGSVTGAAEELGVTQSAVSHSLRELRAVLDDPLFVRAGQRLVPTPRALTLGPVLRQTLDALAGALHDQPSFSPDTATRTFTVATADELVPTLLPTLAADIAHRAPGVRLEIRGRTPESESEALHRGHLDVLFRPKPPRASGLDVVELYSDGFSCIVRPQHPAVGKSLTKKKFLALGHVLVTPEGSGPGIVDTLLRAQGDARRVAVTTRYFMAAPDIVAQSDLIATVPTRLAQALGARVRILKPPIDIPPFTVYRVTSKRRAGDPALLWLLERVDAATKTRR